MKKTITVRPIKTKKEYETALKFIEAYFHAKPNTPIGDAIEVLIILVDKYEEEHFQIEQPDPIEAIKFRMDQLGLTRQDVAELFGGRNRVSEIFSKKRRLTVKMVKSLHEELNIPAESLLGT